MRAYRKTEDRYELKIDSGRLALLGVGAALVLALVFLLGVLVGKALWGAKKPVSLPMEDVAKPPPGTSLDAEAEIGGEEGQRTLLPLQSLGGLCHVIEEGGHIGVSFVHTVPEGGDAPFPNVARDKGGLAGTGWGRDPGNGRL